MKKLIAGTAVVVAAATLTTPPAWGHLPGGRYCTARMAPKAELACATRDRWHALSTLRWLSAHPRAGSTVRYLPYPARSTRKHSRRLAYVASPVRRFLISDHRWLLRESAARVAEARSRLNPWPVPSWWLSGAACIRSHEGWWTANTGNGFYGAYQFLLSTWMSVGGRGFPHRASPGEQTYRAWLVWRRDGGSWREWGTAGACGLR